MNVIMKVVKKHYRLVIVLSILLSIIGLYYASKLEMSSNMSDLLPEESQVLESMDNFEKYFPSQDQGMIVLQGDKSEAIQAMYDIEERLKGNKNIREVFYKMDMSSLGLKALLLLDMEALTTLDLSKEDELIYLSDDLEETFMMIIKPVDNKEEFITIRANFYNDTKDAIKAVNKDYPNLIIGFTGGVYIQDYEADTVAFDGMLPKVIMTLILVIALVIVSFKRLFVPMLILYPLILGAILSAAFGYLIYGSLNMFSISFAMLLIGLGVDFGVHLLSRVLERQHKHIEEDISQAILSTGGSIAFGALTTAIAFLAFNFAKFKAFSQMGVISGIGIVVLAIVMLFVLPSLLMLFRRRIKDKPLNEFKWIYRLLSRVLLKPMFVIVPLVIVSLLLMSSVLNVKVVGDIEKIYPSDMQSLEYAHMIEKAFDYDVDTISVLVDNDEMAAEKIRQLENRSDIKDTISIFDYMSSQEPEKIEFLKTQYNLEITPLNIEDLPEGIKRNYVSGDCLLIEIVPAINLYDKDVYNKLLDGIESIVNNRPVGMPVLMNEVVSLVEEDMIKICSICLLFISILLVFLFKNPILSFITVLPILMTVYLTIAILPLFGKDINIFSIAAFPLILGIGIDAGIHMMHRLKEGASLKSLSATAQAIFLTSMTTVIGFGSLSMINHPGMANLGFTVALGMMICFILTVVIVPLGYQNYKKIKNKKNAAEIRSVKNIQ